MGTINTVNNGVVWNVNMGVRLVRKIGILK